jgi:hypothetical protein
VDSHTEIINYNGDIKRVIYKMFDFFSYWKMNPVKGGNSRFIKQSKVIEIKV